MAECATDLTPAVAEVSGRQAICAAFEARGTGRGWTDLLACEGCKRPKTTSRTDLPTSYASGEILIGFTDVVIEATGKREAPFSVSILDEKRQEHQKT